jgi:catechol 2,3-dioxygenase-like lactoylglutathione lyase family enzyme
MYFQDMQSIAACLYTIVTKRKGYCNGNGLFLFSRNCLADGLCATHFSAFLCPQKKSKGMYQISGIQQMGIGVSDVHEAFTWYRRHFGMDVPVFEEAATAALMLPYTGGQPRDRHAILALNMQGGGGMEIWQYTSRVPEPATFQIQFGDLGIYAAKVKCHDVEAAFHDLRKKNVQMLGGIQPDPAGRPHFYVADPYLNVFEVCASDSWFANRKVPTGGIFGAVIGVTDIERSMQFYKEILGYDHVVFDSTGIERDIMGLHGGTQTCRRVLLSHSKPRSGAFSRLLGASEIELVQAIDRTAVKIFKDRFWGDLGFIHLCFDIVGMEQIKAFCTKSGHPFTVDSSNSFDMGEAAGHFAYIEDPDGTLIEFVETHKVPILKKIGWYLNLRNRSRQDKPLADWMLKTMGFGRVKD